MSIGSPGNPCPTCGHLSSGRETVEVGGVIHGYTGGEFSEYGSGDACKTVEAVGPDWVVARINYGHGEGEPVTATGNGIRTDLARYLKPVGDPGDLCC